MIDQPFLSSFKSNKAQSEIRQTDPLTPPLIPSHPSYNFPSVRKAYQSYRINDLGSRKEHTDIHFIVKEQIDTLLHLLSLCLSHIGAWLSYNILVFYKM